MNTHEKHSEAMELATRVAQKYGRLALTRAAGEAAAAEKIGDTTKRDQWASVVAFLRSAVQEQCMATA